ncbi:MAG: RodZ domain-containing protein, partial [Arsenophonus sp. NC-WZS1-MAG3]
ICIAMVGIWWWQDYKAQKQEISTMAEQNRSNISQIQVDPLSYTSNVVETTEQNNINRLLIKTNKQQPVTSAIANNGALPTSKTALCSEILKNNDINVNIELVNPLEVKTVALPGSITANNSNLERYRKAETFANIDYKRIESCNGVVMNFKGESWLEVSDAKGKILFSGIKNAGQKLELNGELPYQFNIGIPANVNLLFKGNSIDLNHFIKVNRPAKFKLPGL